MYVEHLSLADFRSYATAEVPLDRGVTVFTGRNGQGKTNLVEAVEYLATGGSHRVASDQPLVRAGAQQAIARARVRAGADDERRLLLEIEINPGRANRARINKAPLKSARELPGVLRCVLFAPDDLEIVKGDPSARRAFLDALVITRWPRMAGVKSDYERILRQRNTLLKSLSGRSVRQMGPDAASTLEVWDLQLAGAGAELLAARLDTLRELMPHASASYAAIAPTRNDATAEYKTSVDVPEGPADQASLHEQLLDRIAQRRADELVRGVSLVGPHRDDVVLGIGALPAKGYASHGESWSLALALRLGGYALLRDDGIQPVLVLDDVFAELDVERRRRLAEGVRDAEQVLVTAAVESDVPPELAGETASMRTFRVESGSVQPAGARDATEPAGPADE